MASKRQTITIDQPSDCWFNPERHDQIYTGGEPPAWMIESMTDYGYDPASGDDRDAYIHHYLKPLDLAGTAAAQAAPPDPVGAIALTGESIARRIVEQGASSAFMSLGRIQAFDFLRRVVDVALAQAYVDLKEGKKYKGLPYTDENGNSLTVGTLPQFCAVYLGRSYQRCEELAGNLHVLGAQLYEAAEETGFKSRDYAALRALPTSDQDAVREALGSEDKDRAIQVLADLVSRQAGEKAAALSAQQAAEAQAAEAKADYEAASKIVGEKSAELTKLRVDRMRKPTPLSDDMRVWSQAAGSLIAGIRQSLAQIDGMRADAMQLETPQPDTPAMAAHLAGLGVLAAELDRLNDLVGEVQAVANAHNQTLRAVAYGYTADAAPDAETAQ